MRPKKHRWYLALSLALVAGCNEERGQYALVYPVESMAQVIGGPAAAARVGDLVLENELVRAVVHARHNQRSTFPVGNGSLIDVDIQRPFHRFGAGKGRDAFYELAPMVDLKISSASEITHGLCNVVGASACPERPCSEIGCSGQTGQDTRCARVSVKGKADNVLAIFGLLDLAIPRSYSTQNLEIVNDYDLCPGEALIRVTTRARFYGATGDVVAMPELETRTSLFDSMLGPHSGIDCARQSCPAEAPHCDDVLKNFSLGSLSTEMKRCRSDENQIGGVIGGDLTLFSAKARVFIPGDGFDQETYIRSVFDSGGDVFTNPLALDYMAAVTRDVSYVYFNAGGQAMVPIFAESFTAAVTNALGCPRDDRACFEGKELEFRRFIAVGDGSVASALASFYKVRGINTGQIRGHVIGASTRRPLSGIDVLAIKVPADWQTLSDAELSQKSYRELAEQNRKESKSAVAPLGQVGIRSHFLTDSGLDTRPDGSFGGALPVGRYLLVARRQGSASSALMPVKIEQGRSASTTLELPQSGRLEFVVRDSAGRPLPSKITVGICMPECARDADCKKEAWPSCEEGICVARSQAAAAACRPDQRFDAGRASCVCDLQARLPLEMGGRRWSDGVVTTELASDGRGQIELPPGTYEVIASRGIEYDIVRRFVTIKGDSATRFAATLARVVDTQGFVSADFHVHGPNSVDSGLDHKTRIRSYAAEGIELVSSSDHDQLTDYRPTIIELGVQPWITSQVGVEVSPLDYGHYLGFPLSFNENAELNGGFHWREALDPANQPDWRNRTPGEIFKLIREHGELDQTIVVIAHFYDAFIFFGLDPFTLDPPALSINALLNPVLRAFSGGFDGLEALSGKNYDVLRRPTWFEIRQYNQQLSALLARTDLSNDERQKAWAKISANAQREFLRRTKDEQTLALAYANPDFECRCTQDSDCGPKSLCDERRGVCMPGCDSDSDCDLVNVASNRETCQPIGGADRGRQTCQRVEPACQADGECTDTWGSADTAETCKAGPAGAAKTCRLPCTADADCTVDPLRAVCDTGAGACVPRTYQSVSSEVPCVSVGGTVDDWFQILRRGMRRTVFGNSDSHDIYHIEAGMPRNYVRSSSDSPPSIDRQEITRSLLGMHAFATYGPFVSVSIEGKGLGETLSWPANTPFELSVRVQSPLWFDVDRLEIYKNGQLWRVIEGRADCAEGSNTCLRVPNDRVVNFDATLEDTLSEDAFYVVIAAGLDGRSMAPVYSSTPVARLGMFEFIQRLTPLLPPLRSLGTPLSPTISTVRPYAVTNPIYVDVDGDGVYRGTGTLPVWATDADRALRNGDKQTSSRHPAASQHLHGADHPSGTSHDHRRGLAKLGRSSERLLEALKQGRLTKAMLQQALRTIR